MEDEDATTAMVWQHTTAAVALQSLMVALQSDKHSPAHKIHVSAYLKTVACFD